MKFCSELLHLLQQKHHLRLQQIDSKLSGVLNECLALMLNKYNSIPPYHLSCLLQPLALPGELPS